MMVKSVRLLESSKGKPVQKSPQIWARIQPESCICHLAEPCQVHDENVQQTATLLLTLLARTRQLCSSLSTPTAQYIPR